MSQLFRVLYDFDAEEEGEMTVSAGDIVKILPHVKKQISFFSSFFLHFFFY